MCLRTLLLYAVGDSSIIESFTNHRSGGVRYYSLLLMRYYSFSGSEYVTSLEAVSKLVNDLGWIDAICMRARSD